MPGVLEARRNRIQPGVRSGTRPGAHYRFAWRGAERAGAAAAGGFALTANLMYDDRHPKFRR
jgi:hypothetical protein